MFVLCKQCSFATIGSCQTNLTEAKTLYLQLLACSQCEKANGVENHHFALLDAKVKNIVINESQKCNNFLSRSSAEPDSKSWPQLLHDLPLGRLQQQQLAVCSLLLLLLFASCSHCAAQLIDFSSFSPKMSPQVVLEPKAESNRNMWLADA